MIYTVIRFVKTQSFSNYMFANKNIAVLLYVPPSCLILKRYIESECHIKVLDRLRNQIYLILIFMYTSNEFCMEV